MEAVPEEEEEELLEINLISGQDLKPAIGLRRMQTYAVAWVDPSAKLRTRIDRTGGRNPTWNDRFIFRVPRSFLDDAGDGFGSPAVSIEIYAVGCIVDSLVGAVRLLIGNHRLLSRLPRTPSFAAVQVRRESGRFQGVLNVAAMLLSLAPAAAEAPAIGYRDLMGEGRRFRRRGSWSMSYGGGGGVAALKDLNGREMVKEAAAAEEEEEEMMMIKRKENRSNGGRAFCGLRLQRKSHLISPSDQVVPKGFT
ncbi:hypothetical protein QJS04_geneDACA011137 [Acorus gramineus]|uniref:C2 domain-containing protein n=1 Tax=Acorus gramineus TaxID=55184 RepID=A0AAV9BIC4_ACOGR|nr:hypothetical protein QJS04_geneDACA011137 [Acorus gramineus]